MTPDEKLDNLTSMLQTGLNLAWWIVLMQVIKLALDLIVLYVVIRVFNDVRTVITVYDTRMERVEGKLDDHDKKVVSIGVSVDETKKMAEQAKIAAVEASCRMEQRIDDLKENEGGRGGTNGGSEKHP